MESHMVGISLDRFNLNPLWVPGRYEMRGDGTVIELFALDLDQDHIQKYYEARERAFPVHMSVPIAGKTFRLELVLDAQRGVEVEDHSERQMLFKSVEDALIPVIREVYGNGPSVHLGVGDPRSPLDMTRITLRVERYALPKEECVD